MSRVAKMPVDLPQGVSATIGADAITVKGAKGSLTLAIKSGIKVVQQDKHLEVAADTSAEGLNAIAGATRAHLANMVTGVTKGYEKKLELVGVGYRAAVQIKGIDRQRVGQTAAEIRSFRPPEPYKGKGVKYSDEKISLKEAKKK